MCGLLVFISGVSLATTATPNLTVPQDANGSYKVKWTSVSGAVRYVLKGERAKRTLLNENKLYMNRRKIPGIYGYKVKACSHKVYASSCSPYSATQYVTVQYPPEITLKDQDLDGVFNLQWTENESVSKYVLVGEQKGTIHNDNGNEITRIVEEQGEYGYKVKACTTKDSWSCTDYSTTQEIEVLFPKVLNTGNTLTIHSDETGYGGHIKALTENSFVFSRHGACDSYDWKCPRAELEHLVINKTEIDKRHISFDFSLDKAPENDSNFLILFQDYVNDGANFKFPITELNIDWNESENGYWIEHKQASEQLSDRDKFVKLLAGKTKIEIGKKYHISIVLKKGGNEDGASIKIASYIDGYKQKYISITEEGNQIYQTNNSKLKYRKYIFGLYSSYAENTLTEVSISDIELY